MNKLRVDNIVQMYTNGAIKPPNLAAVLAQEIVEQRNEYTAFIMAVQRRSLWKTLKDWWRWRANRK